MPEWRAFRAIDRALMAMSGEEEPSKLAAKSHAKKTGAAVELPGGGTVRIYPTYTKLTALALEDKGEPITTPELMRYIGNNRPLHHDPEKAKINVTSSLSKDQRFRSVPWENGRAWWWSDREIPNQELRAT